MLTALVPAVLLTSVYYFPRVDAVIVIATTHHEFLYRREMLACNKVMEEKEHHQHGDDSPPPDQNLFERPLYLPYPTFALHGSPGRMFLHRLTEAVIGGLGAASAAQAHVSAILIDILPQQNDLPGSFPLATKTIPATASHFVP